MFRQSPSPGATLVTYAGRCLTGAALLLWMQAPVASGLCASDGQLLSAPASSAPGTMPVEAAFGEAWRPIFTGGGLDGAVQAAVVWDDGGGPALFVGGEFTLAGALEVQHIARWDGAGWAALAGPEGVGLDGPVRALAIYDGALVAGGDFERAGGVSARGIARWDGVGWAPLGAGVEHSFLVDAGHVAALAVYEGELIAGGLFTTAGGVSARHVARWDGSRWAALSGPAGAGTNGGVHALVVYAGQLVVAGGFGEGGGVPVNNIARWDGSRWYPLSGPRGTGLDWTALALAVYGDELVAGGIFSEAGGVAVSGIARWRGGQWRPLGDASLQGVHALAVYGDELVAGGAFGGGAVARWDGRQWSQLVGPAGSGVEGMIHALVSHQGELLVGGWFTRAGGLAAEHLARWDGGHWAAVEEEGLTAGSSERVSALATYDGDLIAAGSFREAGGEPVRRIARWDGRHWSPLSGPFEEGTDAPVQALAVFRGELIAGGFFSEAGGARVDGIARWDGARWAPLAGPAGFGVNGAVHALAVHDGNLVVGGTFESAAGVAAQRVARWDGEQWSPLGAGVALPSGFGLVSALAVYDGELIAGGVFTEAGGLEAQHVARWDGERWHPLGSGLADPYGSASVSALAVYDGELFAAGWFTEAGGVEAENIARWNGSEWAPVTGPEGGGARDRVASLLVFQGALIASGWFTEAGGIPAERIARWDGERWSPLEGPSGSAVNGVVRTLARYRHCLAAGGDFTSTGGVANRRVALHGPVGCETDWSFPPWPPGAKPRGGG